MSIAFRSPVNRPLHRQGHARQSGQDFDFRVTQRFGDPDFYWSKIDPAKAALGHRASDIGNWRCGDPIVAMASGTARRLRDNASRIGPPGTSDALGVRIDHGSGVATEYWHLASYSVPDGSRIAAGQEIGRLGATGLGAVCHTHIEMKVNGQRVDPEPHMFGASWPLDEEDDMDWRGDARVIPLHTVTPKTGTVPYAGPGVGFGEHSPGYRFPAGDVLFSVLQVNLPDGSQWWGCTRTEVRGDAPHAETPGIFFLRQPDIAKVDPVPVGTMTGHTDAELQQARDDARAAANAEWREWLATVVGSAPAAPA